MTATEQTIEKNLKHIESLLKEGKFIEAMESYLSDDVVLQEANTKPKVGKEVCLQAEHDLLATVSDFGKYEIKNVAINGDTSYYEAIMEFTTNDGKHHRFEQVNRTKWKDGKIVNERYYHA